MKKANIHVSSQKIKKSQTDLKKLDALMKDDSLIDISNHEEITEKDIPYLEITLPEKKSERMSLRCTPSIKKFFGSKNRYQSYIHKLLEQQMQREVAQNKKVMV